MAGKNDKFSGVFMIENSINGRVYIGKSNGVGAAIRSAKSKLGKGKFHNEAMQNDWDKLGESTFEFLDPELTEEGEDVKEIFEEIKYDYMNCDWLLYNDISYIKENSESVIISELPNLSEAEKEFVRLIVENIKKINISELTEEINSYA
jgi:hypothetical protein|tara:strand:+ start:594 stop:1040 length:447 start_codon:yes stop_codon:yes gene_type:complete